MSVKLDSSLWKTLRRRILERDHRVCAYCGGVATTVDHIIPRSKWPTGQPGVNDPTNLIAACLPCNSRKKDHIGKLPLQNKAQRRQW